MSDHEYTAYTVAEYEPEDGELRIINSMLGSTVEEIVRVRQEVMEKALRQAVIYELERLGYTVTAPEEDQ